MTTTVKRQTLALGPLTLNREYALHSRTNVPYVSAVSWKVNFRRMPSMLYLVVGLVVVACMGMSMVDPLTWVAMLLWPFVLLFKAFVLLAEIFLFAAAVWGIIAVSDIACRAIRRRRSRNRR